MVKLVWIALAGAGGALARYLLSGLVQRASSSFPWGTLVVNIIGTFVFGFVWSLAEERLVLSGETRLIILAGFMGAFTTFSTFMFETGTLLQDAEWGLAAVNLLAHVSIGLIGLFLGFNVGRLF